MIEREAFEKAGEIDTLSLMAGTMLGVIITLITKINGIAATIFILINLFFVVVLFYFRYRKLIARPKI